MKTDNFTSSSMRKDSVTYGNPYDDHHLFKMRADSFDISSGTSSKIEASHAAILFSSLSLLNQAVISPMVLPFSGYGRHLAPISFTAFSNCTWMSCSFLRWLKR
jgi:hypothetical protein